MGFFCTKYGKNVIELNDIYFYYIIYLLLDFFGFIHINTLTAVLYALKMN